MCCHTEIEVAIPPSHNILTMGQPVLALTLQHHVPGRVATEYQFLSHCYDLTWKKIHGESGNQTQVRFSRGRCPTNKANKVVSQRNQRSVVICCIVSISWWTSSFVAWLLTTHSFLKGRLCSIASGFNWRILWRDCSGAEILNICRTLMF